MKNKYSDIKVFFSALFIIILVACLGYLAGIRQEGELPKDILFTESLVAAQKKKDSASTYSYNKLKDSLSAEIKEIKEQNKSIINFKTFVTNELNNQNARIDYINDSVLSYVVDSMLIDQFE